MVVLRQEHSRCGIGLLKDTTLFVKFQVSYVCTVLYDDCLGVRLSRDKDGQEDFGWLSNVKNILDVG